MFRSVENRLYFFGAVSGDVLPVCAALHNLIHKQGYSDITFDFSSAASINPQFMVSLSVVARSYRRERVDFDIVLPKSAYHARLLRNANWLHLIAPEQFEDRTSNNVDHLSAYQFRDSSQQDSAVVRCINLLLQRVEGLQRDNLKALEWSLTEVTDNVLNHSESHVGGVVQAVSFPARKLVDFYVCDAGIGIPKSLRQGRSDLQDDALALKAAVEEGVTRNKLTNQGNGLYGTFNCCAVSEGEFEILTGYHQLIFANRSLRVRKNTIPFPGTAIRASIAYSYDRLLERALIFKGRPHNPPFDFIERFYQQGGEEIEILVRSEFNSFGSREAGKLARTKVMNLMESGQNVIVFNFDGVGLISSSFADEVFGKLFLEVGPLRFGQLCKFKNVDRTVRALIDRAIEQRMRA